MFKRYLVPGSALLIYLTLAFSGMFYGLPHGNRLLSYNVDETTWLEALSQLDPAKKRFNPHPQLAHPTFYLELYGAAVWAAGKVGYVRLNATKEWLRSHPEQAARFYLVGRYLQVLFGTLLLLSFWWVLQKKVGPPASHVATLLLAVTPSLVAASHFSQASLLVTLLAFGSLACLWFDKTVSAACLAGLAIGTKYSAFPLLIPLLYQIIRSPFQARILAKAGAALLAGFAVASPFAFLAPTTYWAGFMRHAAENVMPVPSAWEKILYLLHVFRSALGGFLALACGAGLLWLVRQKKDNAFLLLWIASFLLATLWVGYIASSARVLIIIPALLIGMAMLVSVVLERFQPARFAVYTLLSALFAATLLPSLALVSLRRQVPLQIQASEWMKENIPRNRAIGIPRSIYWWTPDVVYVSASHPERLDHPYLIKELAFSIDLANKIKPDYLLVSAAERTACMGWQPYRERCTDFLAWLDSGRDYAVVKQFPRDVRWRGWRWDRPERLLSFDDDLWTSSLIFYERLR